MKLEYSNEKTKLLASILKMTKELDIRKEDYPEEIKQDLADITEDLTNLSPEDLKCKLILYIIQLTY